MIGANGQAVDILIIRGQPIEVDCEIASIVRALNAVGIDTTASCSGHGFRPGSIILRDGREIIIARDWDEARKIDALFPIDINGRLSSPDRSGEASETTKIGSTEGESRKKLQKGPPMNPTNPLDISELIERLFGYAINDEIDLEKMPLSFAEDMSEAAEALQYQAIEIERLREHLEIAIDDHDQHFGKALFVGHWTNLARATLEMKP